MKSRYDEKTRNEQVLDDMKTSSFRKSSSRSSSLAKQIRRVPMCEKTPEGNEDLKPIMKNIEGIQTFDGTFDIKKMQSVQSTTNKELGFGMSRVSNLEKVSSCKRSYKNTFSLQYDPNNTANGYHAEVS